LKRKGNIVYSLQVGAQAVVELIQHVIEPDREKYRLDLPLFIVIDKR
jgi:hypothetical protein